MFIYSALALALLGQAIPPELGEHVAPDTLEALFPNSPIRVESCVISGSEFAECALEVGNMQVLVFEGSIYSISIDYLNPGYAFPGISTTQMSELQNAFLCSETDSSPGQDDEALAPAERTLSCPASTIMGYWTAADPQPICTLTFDSDDVLTRATCAIQVI
jgi:hypothetical protein